ncbi:MAG: VOC family protein [Flavobacteriaceae bacterium]
MPHPFHIDFLDHVALRVRDLEVSVAWYEKVLGLKKYQLPEWGPFPIFMLSGKSG